MAYPHMGQMSLLSSIWHLKFIKKLKQKSKFHYTRPYAFYVSKSFQEVPWKTIIFLIFLFKKISININGKFLIFLLNIQVAMKFYFIFKSKISIVLTTKRT